MDTGYDHNENDILIAVMGATGTGKSSFIKLLTNDSDIIVGHDLAPETSAIKTYSYYATVGNTVRNVTLVDTPGFDDNREDMTDVDILNHMADFLQNKGSGRKLNGIIYLYRISDPRMGKMARTNLRMFKNLCGDGMLKNVVLATTFWSETKRDDALRRESNLISTADLFQQLITLGAKLMRHDNGLQSANSIITYLIPKPAVTTQLQNQLSEGLSLMDTAAGDVLTKHIKALQAQHAREMEQLKRDLEEASRKKNETLRRELMEEQAELQVKIQRAEHGHNQLKEIAEKQRQEFETAKQRYQDYIDKAGRKQQELEDKLAALLADQSLPREERQMAIDETQRELDELARKSEVYRKRAEQGTFGRFFSAYGHEIANKAMWGLRKGGVPGAIAAGYVGLWTGAAVGAWKALAGYTAKDLDKQAAYDEEEEDT